MSYTGCFINLDRCPDRRMEMEAEFTRYGLSARYARHPAAEGNARGFPNPRLNNGEIGCFTSHYEALAANRGKDRHIHVVEDDAIFAPCTESVINRIIGSGEIDAFDILYTDIAVPLSNDAYRQFKTLYDGIVMRDGAGSLKSAAFQILKLNSFMAASASSYVVNKNAVDKIHGLFYDELTRGAHLPVDAFLFDRINAGVLKAGFIFPFITSVRIEHIMNSTVRRVSDTTKKFTAANIARYSFFIDCNLSGCEALADRLLPQPPAEDRHAHILEQVLAFSLVDPARQAHELPAK